MTGFLGLMCRFKEPHKSLSLLCFFISSTWRLLVTFDIMVITAQMHSNLLSVLVAITPSWQAEFASLSGLGLISVYQLCGKGTSNSIFRNTGCTRRVLWLTSFCCFEQLATCSIIDAIHHNVPCSWQCKTWQNCLPPCYSQWLRSLGLIKCYILA